MLIIFALVIALLSTQPVFAQQFNIDSPLSGSIQSGTVAPPTGWTCGNGEVTASVDGGPTVNFTENRNRGDTAAPCNNTGDNAFIIADPWNWNIFGNGQHTIVFFLNGVQFASRTFTVATFGTEFLSGSTASFTVQDFPDPGSSVQVEWDPAIQNFRITRVVEGMDTGGCIAQSRSASIEELGQQANFTIDNPCTGNTLDITIRMPLSNTDSIFICLASLVFVQNGMQFADSNFNWQFVGTSNLICEFFLPGITADTEVILSSAMLDFREPFQIFYNDQLIAEFP